MLNVADRGYTPPILLPAMLLKPVWGGNGCPIGIPHLQPEQRARVTQHGYEHRLGGQYGITIEGKADLGYDCFLDAAICVTNSIIGNKRPSLPPWVAFVGGAPRRSRMV